jgi:membrane protein
VHLIRRSAREFVDDRCPQLAGSIAFHVIFSLFPLAIVAVGATSLTLDVTGSRLTLVNDIVASAPLTASGRETLRQLLLGATGADASLGLLGIIGLVYSATGVMGAIRMALNEAWDVTQTRPYLKGKALDLGLVALVTLLAVLSLALTIAARFAAHHVSLPSWTSWAGSLAIPLLVAWTITVFLYRVVPAADVATRDAWSAALLVALLLVIAQNLFAIYLANVAHYNAVYGSLGAVIAFMLFTNIAAQVFLFGAELASELPAVRARTPPAGDGQPAAERLRRAAHSLWSDPDRQQRRSQ